MATSKKNTPAGKKTDTKEKARKDSAKAKPAAPAIVKQVKNTKIEKKESKPSKPTDNVTKNKPLKNTSTEPKSAPAHKTTPKGKEEKQPVHEEQKAKATRKTKGEAAVTTKEGISPAALQAIAAVKASTGAKNKQPARKSSVVTFTMDDVRELLKNKSDGARELAEKKEAAAKKAATNSVIPEVPQQSRVLGAATLADILGFGVQPSAKVEEVQTPHKRDVPTKFRKYFETLSSLREKIQSKMNQRSRATAKTDEDAELTVPAQTDEDDTFDHDFALSLVANEQDALAEIDAAIERIYDGTYGICEITGKEIARERLDAVPFARFSVEGQAQFEMQNRRRSQRAASFMDSSEDSAAFAGEEADE